MRGVILGGWARLEELAKDLARGELQAIGDDWKDLATRVQRPKSIENRHR